MLTNLMMLTVCLVAALPIGLEDPNSAEQFRPGPISDQLREELRLDPFYQKSSSTCGLPILGSANVSDNALAEASWIVQKMLEGRDDILQAMQESRVRVVVMAANEYTTDVPEHRKLSPKLFWDRRARGLGATPSNPVVSCGEENLLGFPRDPYPNENILIHEFAHAIHGTGLNRVDPTFDRRLRAAYRTALERGLWKNTYAATNPSEYWAEGVQSWFDDNAPPDALHNDVRTRSPLKDYDPELSKLCEEVFGDNAWSYQKPSSRKPEDRSHLLQYDPGSLPRFRWRSSPLTERPRVVIQTAAGDIEVELDAISAPEATRNFLAIALNGGYHSGMIQEAQVEQPLDQDVEKSLAGWIGATVNPAWQERWAKDLELEALPAVADQPLPAAALGKIALVRDEADFQGRFVLYFGEPPDNDLDLVPFGQLTEGLEVVRQILAENTNEKNLNAFIDIRRVIRKE